MLHRLSFLALACLFLAACQKENIAIESASPELIASAKTYFEDSVANQPPTANSGWQGLAKKPEWDAAYVVSFGRSTAVVVPVTYSQNVFASPNFSGKGKKLNLSAFTTLLIYRDAGDMKAELVTALPDSVYLSHPSARFTGMKIIESWQGDLLHRFLYQANGSVLSYQKQSNSGNITNGTHAQSSDEIVIQTDYYVDGYNYSDGGGTYYWTEYTGSSYEFVPDYGGVGGGGGGADYGDIPSSRQLHPEQASATHPIASIADYFHCFTNDPSASYTVSVCVDQPEPGTREPWTSSVYQYLTGTTDNPVNVGHSFLVLTETSASGTITRNVGFYPTSYPIGTVPGVYNDDSYHTFNVSASFQVSADMFFNITNYISAGVQGYDLSTNNCTTFALNALGEGHVYLPSTTGSWLGGLGNDPGDFGQDILASNAPGIQKNTLSPDHANQGTCQ